MSNQAELTRPSRNLPTASMPDRGMLIVAMVLFVTIAVSGLVLSGRFESYSATAVPLMVLLSGLLGALAPSFLLKSLFVLAPLLWALGDSGLLSVGASHVNLPMLVGFVVIIAFSPQLLTKDPDPGIERIRKLVLVFALACIPAIFSAQDFFTGTGVYFRVMFPFVIMFAALRYAKSRLEVLRAVNSMVFSLGAAALVLVIAYFQSESWITFGGYTRISALHLPTQDFAVYLTVMVAVVISYYLLTRNRWHLLPIPLVLGGLFFTFYRTAWIGTALLLILFTFEVSKSYGRRLLLAGSIAGAIYFPILVKSILRYDTTVDSLATANKALSGRLGLDIVQVTNYLHASTYHKLFGIGFAQSIRVSELKLGIRLGVHSDYLAMLIEAGAVALPVYVCILIALLRRSRRAKHRARGGVPRNICAAASILMVVFVIMGIPGCWYTEILSNLYVFGLMGLMLGQSTFAKTADAVAR